MKNMKEIKIGDKYGRWTVIKSSDCRKSGFIWWECECSCNNHTIRLVKARDLRNGKSQSCGCLNKERVSESSKRKVINEIGHQYGYLTVIERGKNTPQDQAQWICKCSNCGSFTTVRGEDLRNGHTQSCGCIVSKGEVKIAELLSLNNIPFQKEKIFNDLINPETNYHYRFDFFVDNSYIIEFDGMQHFKVCGGWANEKNFDYIQKADKIKNQWCKDNNIPIIRIPYTALNELSLQDLLLQSSSFII